MKNEYTEHEIVLKCAQNDRAFQEILYRRHFPTMMQVCLRCTNGDRERALEILNNGFLRVFKKIGTFEFKGSLEGWIRQIIRHAISDYFKSNQQYLEKVLLNEPETAQAHQKDQNTEGGIENLYFEDLLKIVDLLPPATREVFRLFAIEGYNHAEISEQLGISVGTSKWHLSTAREKLRTLILADSKINTTLK